MTYTKSYSQQSNQFFKKSAALSILFGFLFASSFGVQAKDMFKLNGETVTSEAISQDARIFLSQNISAQQIEAMSAEQATNLTKSILVKKYLLQQATQDEDIKKSLEQGGALSDALNRVRIDIVSQAYLDTLSQRSVTDEMVQEQYQSFREEMENATQYQLQAVITSSQDDAQKARDEVQNGILFSDVVDKYSIDPQSKDNRGNLGDVISVQLNEDLQKELETLRVYELSDVVQIGENYAIVRYSSKTKPEVPELSEVSANIRQELVNALRQQLVNQVASRIELAPVESQ